ncbi:HNH endonuclease signature motif containing protein [Streptomyces sp. NPDC001212]
MDEPVSKEGWETILKMSISRKRGGQIGRFGVGIKSVLAAYDHGVLVGGRATDVFGFERTTTAATVKDGQTRLSSLAQWIRVPPTRLLREASASRDAARPAWLAPEPYALRRMRVRPSRSYAYRAICRRVLEREWAGLHDSRRQHVGERRVRDGEARQAVLLRCEDRCESPECFKPDLPYRTSAGKTLLQVDHIDDHAVGGRDHPSVMIALCPNCHANKTYGAGRAELKERLRAVAAERHEKLIAER